ncbi:MAG: L-lactate dehydrogenase [Candidatus Altiarchaeota archaeon]|nr:L-lactate dehydrogenase [Candidatus Altiarchaeota archaeon]
MKVGIVGAGNVGATIAYTLSMGEAISEIVLVDKNTDKARGEILDLRHGLPFIPYCDLEWGEIDALAGYDIIVLTAGIGRKPGETRLDLARKNTEVFQQIIPEIVKANSKAIYLVVSNPVDILTYVSLKLSGLKKNQVFGSGNVLDSARFKSILGKYFNVDPSNIHAYVLGEHGDSAFPVYSHSFVGCTPLREMKEYDQKKIDEMFSEVKSVAAQVIKFKGATYYAVSLGVASIIEAIALNKNRVMPASTYLEDYEGISDVCLSVPAVINKRGVDRVLNIPYDVGEMQMLSKSAAAVDSVLKEVGFK